MWWLQCPKMEKGGAMLFILTKGISMALITAPSPKLHFPVRSARLEADSWWITVWWVDAAGINLGSSLKHAKRGREKEWIVREWSLGRDLVLSLDPGTCFLLDSVSYLSDTEGSFALNQQSIFVWQCCFPPISSSLNPSSTLENMWDWELLYALEEVGI